MPTDQQAAQMLGRAAVGLVLICLVAAMASAAIVRRMIGIAVMDIPGHRSAHDRPTPKGGGVGAVAAILVATPLALAILPDGTRWFMALAPMLVGVALLAAVSWADDVRQFSFHAKLSAQVFAALLALASVLAAAPGLPPTPLALIGICLGALAWLMLTTNAMNFIDGLNGLASGSTALVCFLSVGLGWNLGDPLMVALAVSGLAGLAGFLPFNYPTARIFLGDVGSQVCGLLAGTLALYAWGDDGWGLGGMTAVPLMLAGILWDVLFTLARRAISHERLTQPHRGHLYQVAARAGVARAIVALVHWGFVIWGGALAATLLPENPVPAMVFAILPQLGWTGFVRHRARRAGLDRWSS